MANTIREQKIVDNTKRALLKYVFLGDGTAETNTLLIDVSNLSNALNANGLLMVSNTHQKAAYKTKIKRIFGQAKVNSYITLAWSGLNATPGNVEIVSFGSGSFDYDFESMGDGATIANPNVNDTANCNGDIVFTINGSRPNDVFTLFVDLRKDASDYNAGQINDPTAFNQGPAAGFR